MDMKINLIKTFSHLYIHTLDLDQQTGGSGGNSTDGGSSGNPNQGGMYHLEQINFHFKNDYKEYGATL